MGEPVTWYDKFFFLIKIDGIVWAAFTTCSELAIESANVQYWEGGRRHAHNSPGRVTFPEITLTRGSTNDDDLYNWWKDTYDAAAGTGMDTPSIFRQFEIVQLNLARQEVAKYKVHDAYCRRFVAGDWDANADEKRMEQVVVQPDYWEKVA